jgi:hypothetical protein
MGFNATVVVNMDKVDNVGRDSLFGKKLYQACCKASINSDVYIDHGASVIETHHADTLVPVLVGANSGRLIRSPVSDFAASTFFNPNENEYDTNVRLL